jgi:hypothetical protein
VARFIGEPEILLGVAVAVLIVGAAAGQASAAPRPGAPEPKPVPVPPLPTPVVPGAPTDEQKKTAQAMTLEPGHTYEAYVKTPDALAPFMTESAVADEILKATGMLVTVTKVDSTHWKARGMWAMPSTPISRLPPEVEWIREVRP